MFGKYQNLSGTASLGMVNLSPQQAMIRVLQIQVNIFSENNAKLIIYHHRLICVKLLVHFFSTSFLLIYLVYRKEICPRFYFVVVHCSLPPEVAQKQ